MTLYRQEVADMDRRYRRRVRAATFAGAALLALAALWSARVSLYQAWVAADHWLTERDASDAVRVEENRSPALPSPAPQRRVNGALAGSDAVVPTVPQPLQLVSTSPGRSNREGTARLGIDRRAPQTYIGGAILANGSQLKEIYADRVVLERDGKRLTLFVESARNTGQNPALAMVGGPPRTAPAAPRFANDPLTDVIRAMPVYDDNEMLLGMQVFAGQKTGVFAQLGLQAGDVITSLDGAPITDWQTALEQLHTLLEGAALNAAVRRGAHVQAVSIDGNIVAAAVAPQTTPRPDLMADAPH
jgi:type II secretion system (T2SS) protein C